MAKTYVFSNYTVYPWTEDTPAENKYGYKWYTILQSPRSDKKSYLGFTSLADARSWCKRNYLDGVFHGWIKP